MSCISRTVTASCCNWPCALPAGPKIDSEAYSHNYALQARPGKTANTERNLFVLHVLQLLLGLGAVQPLFWLVSARSWKAFLAVSALCHLYKVRVEH